mmetsp:Transcript_6588/g.9626  ORF Transcript_6588/g.9626 Transcript_6588/m.9626 type:complete len:679 (-) Transcript_6588:29-2065(-)
MLSTIAVKISLFAFVALPMILPFGKNAMQQVNGFQAFLCRGHTNRRQNVLFRQSRLHRLYLKSESIEVKFDKNPYYLGLKPFIKKRNSLIDDGKSNEKDTLLLTLLTKESAKDRNVTVVELESDQNHTKQDIDHNKTDLNNSTLSKQAVKESKIYIGTKESKAMNSTMIPSNSALQSPASNSSLVIVKRAPSSSLDSLEKTIRESFSFFEEESKLLMGSMQPMSKPKSLGLQKSLRNGLKPKRQTVPSIPFLNITSTGTNPNAPVTMAELQSILDQYGYLRRDEMDKIISKNPMKTSQNNETVSGQVKRTKSGVAFPQPSVLSQKHIRQGTMISSGFFALLIAITIRPNLWLIGSIIGVVYGYDIAEKAMVFANAEIINGIGAVAAQPPGGIYGDLSLRTGKKIATNYLKAWDFAQGVYFMYRTGQLSYEYYKTYAVLDKRFAIQNKMDAWNARFIEGKENFDAWEKENEIGRKVLAGLRTAWLVEENSYKNQMSRKKGRKRSKYRIAQLYFDIIDYLKRFINGTFKTLTGGNNDLQEIIKGTRLAVKELNLEIISQRMSAAVAALVAVNFVGALFAVAPYMLGFVSVLTGVIWPNWYRETMERIKEVIEETKARGRGEKFTKRDDEARKGKLPFVNKTDFHFYIKPDGKKQWYRSGQSYKNREYVDQGWFYNFFGDR